MVKCSYVLSLNVVAIDMRQLTIIVTITLLMDFTNGKYPDCLGFSCIDGERLITILIFPIASTFNVQVQCYSHHYRITQ